MAMRQSETQDTYPLRMSEASYLAFDADNDIKHEFVNGRVYAMTGASVNHNVINSNATTILNTQLRETPCIVMSSDMRLKVESVSVSYRYPDIVVVCDEVQLAEGASQTVINPIVIVEVLSPSTALRDYNEKLAEYTQIDSLQAYLLISQHAAKVEAFTRNADGNWVYSLVTGLESGLTLEAINCRIDLVRLYNKVSFQVPGEEA